MKAEQCWLNTVVYTATVPEYIQTMSEEVSSLEAARQRIEEAAQSSVGVLESLNTTVVNIETRSAAALSNSKEALQVLLKKILPVYNSVYGRHDEVIQLKQQK